MMRRLNIPFLAIGGGVGGAISGFGSGLSYGLGVAIGTGVFTAAVGAAAVLIIGVAYNAALRWVDR